MALDDAQGSRTLFRGILIGFAVYAVSFAVPYFIEGQLGQWVSLGLLAVSMIFVLAWFIAVRRGFRIGKAPNKQEVRAKEKMKAERAKKMKLSRR